MKGNIQLILGCMYSGKSSELLRRIRRYSVSNLKTCIIKYDKDKRYSNENMCTHDKQTYKALVCAEHLLNDELHQQIQDKDVIGIDEGQFFADIVEFSEMIANNGKIVIIAGLDGTFERKPFGSLLQLVPLSESVIKLNSVCMECKKDAAFTYRISNESETIIIGGIDRYLPLCRECYFEKTSTKFK